MAQLTEQDLKEVSALTIGHYQENANRFWIGTKDHDVTQNYEALLSALPEKKGLKILDLGCGPGRDCLYFKGLGHEPTGLDGCEAFCEMAKKLVGCEVLHQDFLKLNLPQSSFDGIFANASLFHVPRQELSRVLKELRSALKDEGALFSSNPRGSEEGWQGDRYGAYMEFKEYESYLSKAGFEVIHHYYRPKDKPPAEQPWLAVVARAIKKK